MVSIYLISICGVIAMLLVLPKIFKLIRFVILINKIPGPSFISSISDAIGSQEKVWRFTRNLSKKYTKIHKVWFGYKPFVALLCPDDLEIILSSTKHITKSDLYTLLNPWLGTGLLTSSGDKWQKRRKILTPAFHFNILQEFLEIFVEQSEVLIDELKEECQELHTNIVPIISKSTLHAICKTAMGNKLHKNESWNKNYISQIYRMGELIVHRSIRPWLYSNIVYFFTSKYREVCRVTNFLHKVSTTIIQERKTKFEDKRPILNKSKSKSRLAMLDLLISAQHTGEDIDDEGIREEVDTFMFEGHDTTAMSICFTLLLLANHQDIQERVVEEIKEIFGDSDRKLAYDDLPNLRYLELVIKESLRLYPSVPLITRTLDEDIHSQTGYTIPEGAAVHLNIYDIHHNPELYPEPEKFDPDRFLPDNIQHRHRFAYIPFSAGSRNCIGQRFAMFEMKTTLSYILRNFIIEPIDSPEDIILVSDLIIRTRDGIKIKFKRRS